MTNLAKKGLRRAVRVREKLAVNHGLQRTIVVDRRGSGKPCNIRGGYV